MCSVVLQILCTNVVIPDTVLEVRDDLFFSGFRSLPQYREREREREREKSHAYIYIIRFGQDEQCKYHAGMCCEECGKE